MASRLSWFTTLSGRSTIGVLSTIGVGAIFSVEYFPNTMMIDHYRNFFTVRKLGSPMKVPDDLMMMVNNTLDDLSFDDFKKKLFRPFIVDGFDYWHAGTTTSRFGSLIGLPISSTYTSVDSIDKNQLMINKEPVNWNRNDAKNLLSSLVLSDDAKKFAIAREILMTDNYNVLIQSSTSATLAGTCYAINSQINDSYKMFNQSRGIRMMVYFLVGAFCLGVWAMQKDAFTMYYEKNADIYLSQLGEKYIKGGCEFYQKLLERNIALRSLLGAQGEKIFTPKGNEAFFLRQKRLPINARLDFFKEQLMNSPHLTKLDSNIATA